MPRIDQVKEALIADPKKWLVTGAAGFIGSNILEQLLGLGQTVVGIDNFSTGKEENLKNVQKEVGYERWQNFQFLEGDIRHLSDCHRACKDVDYVLHQAASAVCLAPSMIL